MFARTRPGIRPCEGGGGRGRSPDSFLRSRPEPDLFTPSEPVTRGFTSYIAHADHGLSGVVCCCFFQMLSSFRALSPTLPPSPPPSRSPSPRPTSEQTSSSSSVIQHAQAESSTGSTSNKRSIPSPPSENDDPESRKRSRVDEEAAKQRAEAQRSAQDELAKQQAAHERRRKRASEVWDTERFKKLGRV